MRFSDRSEDGFPSPGWEGPKPEGDRWERLVRRIVDAATPELARLRVRQTVTGRVQAWKRSLLPLAAVLILAFGSLLAWVDAGGPQEATEDPLLARVLMPDPLVAWVEGGGDLTVDEMVTALEESER